MIGSVIVSDVEAAMARIAPLEFAAEWDNTGLLVGRGSDEAGSILLTIDLTAAVLDEARAGGANMIVAYHPPIFDPLRSLTDRDPRQRVLLESARAGIALYSPHTALDAAPGGVNDWLAEGLGAGDVRALNPHESLPETEQCKLVTFCPPDATDRLREALATAGAGRIGGYALCSFETLGTGTFLGGEGTSPTIGKPGRLERVQEARLEMVCPVAALPIAIATLKQFHPYEEPPIEVHPLRARPLRSIGQGRRVVLDEPQPLEELVTRIKKLLGVRALQVAAADDVPRQFESIGVCAGAGGSLLAAATAAGCRLFLTGEMRHHDVLAASAAGCTVLLAGHTSTERGYLQVLRRSLAALLPDATIAISRRDSDPLREV